MKINERIYSLVNISPALALSGKSCNATNPSRIMKNKLVSLRFI